MHVFNLIVICPIKQRLKLNGPWVTDKCFNTQDTASQDPSVFLEARHKNRRGGSRFWHIMVWCKLCLNGLVSKKSPVMMQLHKSFPFFNLYAVIAAVFF